ncbi:MAG: SGNH/GDSL hydrolase family protein [bacterium]|nr:SGNH/GDSL hydrolase family protein [bacterium]
MKKLVIISLVLCGALFAYGGCGIANMTNPAADEYDVQIVGDSVFDLDAYIHEYLWELSGKAYKDNSSSGDTLSYITQQYRDAIAAHPGIKTVIMDAGANDILMDLYWNSACRSYSGRCPSGCKTFINSVVDDLESLWDEMDADGVDDIVHLGYYHLKWGYLVGNGSRLDGAVDYADSKINTACAVSPADCWFVDPRSDFEGNEGAYLLSDGLHPTDAGGEVLAGLIWDTMVAEDTYR